LRRVVVCAYVDTFAYAFPELGFYAMIDLDPRDPKAGAHENPLAQYLTIPNGINVVAAVQVLIGILFAYTAVREFGARAGAVHVASLAGLAVLFLGIGVGFWRCRAWAWWLLSAVYSFLLINTLADLARGTRPDIPQRLIFLVVALVAESALLIYIHRERVLRHMSFRGPPGAATRFSAAITGVALAIAAIARTVRP